MKNNNPKLKGKKNERTVPKYLCVERHYFNQCEHINLALGKQGYVENRNIMEKIRIWLYENDEKYEKRIKSLEKNNGVLAEYLQDREAYATISKSFASRLDQDRSVIWIRQRRTIYFMINQDLLLMRS